MRDDLFDRLDCDWRNIARRRHNRSHLARWARLEPPLACHDSLDAVIADAQRRGQPDRSDAILLALARLARNDQLAGRVLLQAILPGLRVIARRRYGLATFDDIDAAVIAAAWEQITRYPCTRRPHRVAANLLFDTRQRLERTRIDWQDPAPASIVDPDHVAAPVGDQAAFELLGVTLADAVRDGTVQPCDAQIIWATRSFGIPTADVVFALGFNERQARQRRERAERRLARDGAA